MVNKREPKKTSELEFCEKVKAENKNEDSVIQEQYVRLMPAFYPNMAIGDTLMTIHFSVE
ncbi:hypothetical protein IJG92_00450 [Candidatus Saccharibacteria bacterium]|nr:hypothetical protein [Candidatus Saccharibacteria bacterium]